MREEEGGSGIGRRLEAEARRVAAPRPDFEKVYGILRKDAPGRILRHPSSVRSRIARILPYAAAACLALCAGFALGRFAKPGESGSSYIAQAQYTLEPGIQNDVRLYLDDLWGASPETVSWSP